MPETSSPTLPASSVGSRMAEVRRRAGLTQQEAAERLGISRSALSQLESGASLPSFETLRRAHQLYAASYAYLMEGVPETAPAPARSEGPGLVSITVDAANNPNIVLVPVKAQAGYAASRLEPEQLGSLPAFNLPGHQFRNQTFRAFEVAGESMEPTLFSGDVLICTLVANWNHLWPGELFVVVLQEDVLVKRLQQLDRLRGVLSLTSDNPYYQPIEVALAEVVEIWRVSARITQNLPSPQSQADRLRAWLER